MRRKNDAKTREPETMPVISQQIKKLILLSALVALTGIAFLLILVVSDDVGPTQIILIALILLLWPVGVLFSYYVRRRQAPAEADAEAPATPKKAPSTPAPRVNEEMERGAHETTQWLEENLIGGEQGAAPIYQLPWFLIAGPPKAGKTSLLLSAGMTFNALPSQRRADQNLLRPTGSCDWRVTDQAIWIDTAGHYQTERAERADGEGDQAGDRD